MREEVLLPCYIPAEQRKLLTRKQQKDHLDKNPITVEIDGVVHKLGYRDPITLPSPRRTVLDAVKLMDSERDFRNLVLMLQGLHSVAKTKWQKPWDMTRIARRAGGHGQIFRIIEAANRVGDTGVKFDHAELIAEVMYWIQEKACGLQPGAERWGQKATAQALNWADMVVEMLHLPEHLPAATPKGQPLGLALKYDPKWTGAQLHLAAGLAVKHPKPDQPEADAAQRKRVTDLATTLIKTWPADKGLRAIHPPPAHPKGYVYFIDQDSGFLRQASPIMHGLDLAMQVVEPELANQLKSRRDALAAEIDEVLAKKAENQLRGRMTYDALFGTQHALELVGKEETQTEA